jgi:hypothetical protein
MRSKPLFLAACLTAVAAVVFALTLSPSSSAGITGKFSSVCFYSHSAPDDAILYPGKPGAAHLHDFIANPSVDAFSTVQTLQAARSNCLNTKDTAAYWVPSLTSNGTIVHPSSITVYYLTSQTGKVTPYPLGFKQIAGNMHATSAADARNIRWGCSTTFPDKPEAPTCKAGENLHVRIDFADCWDGKNLDSPDHVSHVAYSSKGKCPANFPVLIPLLQMLVKYPVSDGRTVRLSSGGSYSMHGDFFNAWDAKELADLVDKCLNAHIDCPRPDGATDMRRLLLAFLLTLALPVPAANATSYYTGDYKVSLNLYSFNLNLNAWLRNRKGAPPIDTISAIRWAAAAGFDAVDVTVYYIPGYENESMPTKPRAEVLAYVHQIRDTARQLKIDISGTGIQNDFADPDPAKRALDVQRGKFWLDMAAEMGAPVMRVYSGLVPPDIDKYGWTGITQDRIIPALRELAAYGAGKGVKIGLQNHGDMTATAGQTIEMLRMVNSPNIGIIDDTGYFRPFRSDTGEGYDWYTDIAEVLPYTNNFQVKKKPGGAETQTPMDLDRLFRSVRASSYRGYISLELLWVKTDPGYPRDLKEPPFDQIKEFLGKVHTALEQTKPGPRVTNAAEWTKV